jgi:hypothetical protein
MQDRSCAPNLAARGNHKKSSLLFAVLLVSVPPTQASARPLTVVTPVQSVSITTQTEKVSTTLLRLAACCSRYTSCAIALVVGRQWLFSSCARDHSISACDRYFGHRVGRCWVHYAPTMEHLSGLCDCVYSAA